MKSMHSKKRKFKSLLLGNELNQKEAAAKSGISAKTAGKWADDLLPSKGGNGRHGSRYYSPMETATLKEQMIVCLAGFGMKQKDTAAMLGVAPKTICEWVKEIGGKDEMLKQFNNSRRLFKDSANGLLIFIKKNKSYQHIFPIAEAAFKEYLSIA